MKDTHVRIPQDVWDRLVHDAAANRRRPNEHLTWLLEQALPPAAAPKRGRSV